MEARPNLLVRICLNVGRIDQDERNELEITSEFGRRFMHYEWPSSVAPQLYYYPRAFVRGTDSSVLHAKCVLVDDQRAFVTSANLTEAAHTRNVEVGVLINDSLFTSTLRHQFETLIQIGDLKRIALL
jgi:phosphatidylserine/phosphatidylglycerophosphate/cardiolipin synthase-like enzyme